VCTCSYLHIDMHNNNYKEYKGEYIKMKIEVKTSEFLKGISSVEGVISVRELRSILSNIKIEAEEEHVYLSATDLEISLKTTVNAKVIQPGTISLPAKQLSSSFKTLNFENALLEINDEYPTQVLITDADKKVDFSMNINGADAEEIKTISKVEDSMVAEIDCQQFAKMIKKTAGSVAVDDTRYVFNGLFVISKEEKLSAIGTDGRRLAKIDRINNNHLPFDKGIIIPHKAIREIQKMIDLNPVGKVGFIEEQIYFAAGNVEMLCKLLDGTFPDYESVIPKSTSKEARIAKDKISIALRQALIAAEEPSRQIRLKFHDNILNINSSTPGATEVNINLPIEYTDDETTIGFKGEYLVDVVKTIEGDEVIIGFTTSNAPVVFKDPADLEFLTVIMPMKL
jgi:DNA polymerase III subunit beta